MSFLFFFGADDVQLIQLSLLHKGWCALVAASTISLVFACGESSLIMLRLLSPQSLEYGFAGAPMGSARYSL